MTDILIEKTKVDDAGLFRCCPEKLADMPKGTVVQEGQFVACKYCKDKGSGVKLRGTIWVAAWVYDQEEINND